MGFGTLVDSTVYIGIFWLDSAQVVTHKVASLDKADVIAAARSYVIALKVESADYENFLLMGLGEWDGEATHANEVEAGKLVLFSTPLGSGDLHRG